MERLPNTFRGTSYRTRRGATVLYAAITLTVMCAFTSFAVDLGRAQVAKTELQRAADSVALYAAAGLSQGVTEVKNRVTTAAADNMVDGKALSIDSTTDLEFGVWDPASKTFTVLTGAARSSATAVRVTTVRTASRGNAVPTLFASLFGRPGVDVTARAIATRGRVTSQTIDADACPWLAGMPNGSQVAGYGGNTTPALAPAQSPKLASGLGVVPGSSIFFRQTTGTTSYQDAGDYGPDGQTDWIVEQQAANGINSTKAPLNCLVGIFLDARAPNTYAQEIAGDFSTTTSRNFDTLSPKLKQVFFVGDGQNSSGNLQEFVVPAGATRLYLGIMDEKGWWWDNTGTLTTSVMDEKVTLVK